MGDEVGKGAGNVGVMDGEVIQVEREGSGETGFASKTNSLLLILQSLMQNIW